MRFAAPGAGLRGVRGRQERVKSGVDDKALDKHREAAARGQSVSA